MQPIVSAVALRLAACFLLGSIPFAVIAMAGSGVDIRQVGSGNPGFNNVLRVSKWRAVLTLIGDMGKGALAVWLALYARPVADPALGRGTLGWMFGFAAVLGHCYSPFLKFNGGKGIATSGGVMLVLHPVWAAVALIYFALARVTLAKLKWREAGATASMSAWLLFIFLMFFAVGRTDAAYAALMTVFLGWRHKKNIRNLFAPAPEGATLPPARD
jgi:glycerol-3-phosphate acyltransferase PlsY